MLVGVVTRVHRLFIVRAIGSTRRPGGLERHGEQQQDEEKTAHRIGRGRMARDRMIARQMPLNTL
jgi:hypothetical protein